MAGAAGYGALLDALRGVGWPARRSAHAGLPGAHHSKSRGYSTEFTEYRVYRQGDDPRRLDWKLLARTDRAYLRITHDRTTLDTRIVVDATASMAFPPATLDKWRQACLLTVGLAAVAHAAGDPVGMVVCGDGSTRSLAPRTRRGVLSEIARLLEASRPSGSTPLAGAVRAAGAAARVVVVTDLLGDGEELLSTAGGLVAGGSEVYLVHVVAREELEPAEAVFTALDPESPELRRPLAPESRLAYRRAFADWRRATRRKWRSAGAAYIEVTTDEPPAQAVRRVTSPRHIAARIGP